MSMKEKQIIIDYWLVDKNSSSWGRWFFQHHLHTSVEYMAPRSNYVPGPTQHSGLTESAGNEDTVAHSGGGGSSSIYLFIYLFICRQQ